MSNEIFNYKQLSQMIISAIQLIAGLTGLFIAVITLIWSGGALWLGYRDKCQQRCRR